MCLLTFLPAGVQPDADALWNGTLINDNGHGYAIVTGDRILTGRGMNADEMVGAFAVLRREFPDGPALFHSRFTTHGETSLDNCHPFAVGGDERTVIAHNGVLPSAVQPGKGDRRSDTRIVAEDFLPQFGSLRARRTRMKFERWMTRFNKMVVLTVDRRFKQRAYILNERAGIWDGGIWYSNDGYRPLRVGRHPVGDTWLPRIRHSRVTSLWAERCGFCDELFDLADGNCRRCGWCADCCELPTDCFCYSPAFLDRRGTQGSPTIGSADRTT